MRSVWLAGAVGRGNGRLQRCSGTGNKMGGMKSTLFCSTAAWSSSYGPQHPLAALSAPSVLFSIKQPLNAHELTTVLFSYSLYVACPASKYPARQLAVLPPLQIDLPSLPPRRSNAASSIRTHFVALRSPSTIGVGGWGAACERCGRDGTIQRAV